MNLIEIINELLIITFDAISIKLHFLCGSNDYMNKVIAVDIDNVLNNFDDTLRTLEFTYDKSNRSWGAVHQSAEEFMRKLKLIKQQKAEASYDKTLNAMWNHAHKLAHLQAKVKQGASEFLWYLKANNYRVIIMTRRDLRYALAYTQNFLENNNLPYDDMFQSNRKASTCRLWNIPILIDDEIEPIRLSNKIPNPVQVYYPIMDKHKGLGEDLPITARGYHYFRELQQWIK